MRIYGNSRPGHRDASIDGGHLLKVVDRIVNSRQRHSTLTLEATDERIEWQSKNERRQFIESKFLFSILSPPTSPSPHHHHHQQQQPSRRHRGQTLSSSSGSSESRSLYIGLNRVIASDFRRGSGLCRAVITLYADYGQLFTPISILVLITYHLINLRKQHIMYT